MCHVANMCQLAYYIYKRGHQPNAGFLFYCLFCDRRDFRMHMLNEYWQVVPGNIIWTESPVTVLVCLSVDLAIHPQTVEWYHAGRVLSYSAQAPLVIYATDASAPETCQLTWRTRGEGEIVQFYLPPDRGDVLDITSNGIWYSIYRSRSN